MEMNRYETISEVAAANRAAGHHWFDPSTLRFFKSKIYGVFNSFDKLTCNRYFISSEVNPSGERRFSVRMVDVFDHIETIGKFHSYYSRNSAEAALWEHANKACDCGHLPTVTDSPLTPGYARMPHGDDRTMCYACADRMTLQDIETAPVGDRITLYISSDGNSVTTWTGGQMMRVVHWGSVHPWSRGSHFGERNYIRVIDHTGHMWYGTGANGMYATLRKAKA